jgi:hypothetical protein
MIFASPWLKHLQRFAVPYLSQVTTDCAAVVLRGDETRGSYMHTIQASVSAAGRSLVQVCCRIGNRPLNAFFNVKANPEVVPLIKVTC